MKKTALTIVSIVSACFFAYAQATPSSGASPVTFTPLVNLINSFQILLDRAVPLLVSLAVLGLFWFLIIFIWKGPENPEVRQKAKQGIIWALFAIFMMVAIWGIISFISSTLGIGLGGQMQEFKLPGT